jgi:hypothetical protein
MHLPSVPHKELLQMRTSVLKVVSRAAILGQSKNW